MEPRHRVFLGLIAIAAAALLPACGGPAPQQPPTETAAAPAAAPPPDVAGHMREHFTKVAEVEQAVIRGDLEATKEPAKWIAEHQETAGLPASGNAGVAQMKAAAKQVVEAADIKAAAKGTAAMAAACGTCHATTGAKPSFAVPAAPAAANDMAARMLVHQYATDLLYQGLAGPSDTAWIAGAAVLKASSLNVKKAAVDPKLAKERTSAEVMTHDLADKAAAATGATARSVVYAELVAGCASCHTLHGRVVGTGLPK